MGGRWGARVWVQLEAWSWEHRPYRTLRNMPSGTVGCAGWGWGGEACDHVTLALRPGRGSEPGRLGPGAPMAQGRGVEAEGEEE